MEKKSVVVKNGTGIHARPASLLVKVASSFKSDVKLIKGDKECNAKSIMNLLTIGVSNKDEIIVWAEGEDEKEAVAEIVKLIESDFGEK